MGREKFVKFYIDRLSDVNEYHPALVLYGYLESCDGNPYIPKDDQGFFELSSTRLFGAIKYKRSILEKARRVLREAGLLRCKLGEGRSPTIKYKIIRRKKWQK